ncbi:sugar transferase [Noviherbaspirillum humi]|uniref:sugar transferase n=1 Tax=Noviherbaspirillum humi TaxID=1688639 RepID=UPI001C3DB948|nr:sugar transferase [Noviherbaspirillum humi]
MTKRIFDFVAALSGLLILSPILILIAAVVKLDSPGPVFFRQERVGIHGSVFRIYKFRTMTLNAEAKGQLTIGEDERVTRVGHALRRFKLDELPQLINVILGDMSLVGPRPEVVRYVAKYPKALRDAVLSVRPGITDWASIEFKEENAILGKSHDPERSYVETIMPIKLDYYVRYVHERSFVMDLKIIGHTLLAVASLHRKRDP